MTWFNLTQGCVNTPAYWLAIALSSLFMSISACDATPAANHPTTVQRENSAETSKATAPIVVLTEGTPYNHNASHFTQGLIFDKQHVIETTGLHGQSGLYRYTLGNDDVEPLLALNPQFFGEGLTRLGPHYYWLTWKKQTLFKIDATTLALTDQFRYRGEGWGLTTDGKQLIKSNGSARITFHDPDGFKQVRYIDVTDGGTPVNQLNELEWINGYIYANIWFSDDIVKIQPLTGDVVLRIDASILRHTYQINDRNVLNGIAHNAATGKTLLTGKNWPVAIYTLLP